VNFIPNESLSKTGFRYMTSTAYRAGLRESELEEYQWRIGDFGECPTECKKIRSASVGENKKFLQLMRGR